MALTHLGAVSASIIAPVQSYTAATRTTSAENFPIGYSSVLMMIDLRNITSPTSVITWEVEYSINGGGSWDSAGGGGIDIAASNYTLPGGVLTNAEGAPVRITASLRQIPRTDLARLVRLRITNNETMTVGVTVAGW